LLLSYNLWTICPPPLYYKSGCAITRGRSIGPEKHNCTQYTCFTSSSSKIVVNVSISKQQYAFVSSAVSSAVLCPSRRKTRSFRWPTSRYQRVQFDYCNWKPNADRAGLPTLTREPVGPSPSPLPARTGKHHAQPPHVQELHGIKNPASASWPAGGGSDRIGCVLPLLARPAVGWGCRRGDVAQAGTLLRRVFYSRKALDILASPTPFRSLRLQREGPAPSRAHQTSTHILPGDLESSSDFASSPSARVSPRGRRVSRCLSFASTATCWPRMALPSS
jgi:hypothetical protein